MSAYTPYKKSQDEMKLDFHNACIENSRKYRLMELNNSQNEFKRKYVWCLPRENSPSWLNSNGTSRDGKSRSINKRNMDRVSDKITSSSLDKNLSENRLCSPQAKSSLSTSIDNSVRPSYCSEASTESETVVSSASSKRTSVARGDYPGLLNRRRTSVLDVNSEERVDYLQDLWNKVFPADSGNFSHRNQIERRQNLACRDVFTSLVMNQFKDGGTDTQPTKLPLIVDILGKQQPEQAVSDTKISKPEIPTHPPFESDKGTENIVSNVAADNDDKAEHEETPSQCIFKEQGDPLKDEDDTRQQVTTQNVLNTNMRRKSMNIQLLKPPFQNFVGRSRSQSMDSSMAEGMWKSGIFNVLMRSSKKKCFQNCVMAAVNKGRVESLQGRKWRAEMRKCRYLRLPDNSNALTPVNSDSESEY